MARGGSSCAVFYRFSRKTAIKWKHAEIDPLVRERVNVFQYLVDYAEGVVVRGIEEKSEDAVWAFLELLKLDQRKLFLDLGDELMVEPFHLCSPFALGHLPIFSSTADTNSSAVRTASLAAFKLTMDNP